jgi:outer membrane protein
MKNLRITVLTLVLLAATALSASAQTKVATVDMKKIFNSYWKTKQATIALENRKTELRMEMKKSTDDLEKAQTDYKTLLDQSNDQAISADERAKRKDLATAKAKEIANSKIALEQFQRQAEAQLQDQSQRMSGNLVTEIQGAVADKAKAGGYTMVFNAAALEVVVYADSKVDITDSVVSQLNAGAPIDLTKPISGVPLNLNTNL